MPEVLQRGDIVRLNEEGANVRITDMARWKGTILKHVNKDYVRVMWNQRNMFGDARVWTERIEFLAKA